jgi:glycosyltransferase involved in cell wall biosynthesis
LVAGWKSSFPIRYFWKPNAGKHTAMNLGVSVARGELVLFFDSDDRCVPHALERFAYHWRQIPDPSRFWNLCCLCATPAGAIVGKSFPADHVDALTFADQIRYLHSGPWGSTEEKWGVNRTDLLRQCPWPEGERYAPESLVWNRLARQYASRFVNEALRIYEPNTDGISRNVTDLRISSPRGTLTYYRELALSPAPATVRLRAAINFCRFAAITAPRRLGRFMQSQR